MNRADFMSDLRFYLEKAYKCIEPKEIDDILRDYDEYFREGLSEGKSEDDIAFSLGNPKEIVDEMVKNDIEDGKYKQSDFLHFYSDYNDEEKKEKYKEKNKIRRKNAEETGLFFKRVILPIVIFFFDIMYFPVIVIATFGILLSIGIALLAVPIAGSTLDIIGMSSILVIFPILFAVGVALLIIWIFVILFKLGIKINSISYGVFKGGKR